MKTFSAVGFALVCAAALSACVAIGSFGKFYGPNMETSIVAALPVDDRALHAYGSVYWSPGKQGLDDGLLTRGIAGAIAVTNRAVYFEQWNNGTNALRVSRRIDIHSLAEVRFDRRGLAGVGILGQKDGTSDGFLMTHADLYTKLDETEEVVKYLQSLLDVERRP